MKYMGSKSRLSKDLLPIINNIIKGNNLELYIEPFVGGANLIDKVHCAKRVGGDNNYYLIEMWRALQKGWLPPKEISKEEYNDIKVNKEKYSPELVAIAGFCATYNAKWFGGYAGIVHTKSGVIRNYYNESVRNILKQVEKIKDVEFTYGSYTQFSNIKGALIYCDIPYKNTTQYGTSKCFDYEGFWDWVRYMSKENIVLVSEYNAPSDFKCVWSKDVITTLDKNSRKKDTEKLFTINKGI